MRTVAYTSVSDQIEDASSQTTITASVTCAHRAGDMQQTWSGWTPVGIRGRHAIEARVTR